MTQQPGRREGPRGLDHIVHVVRDLDTAGAFYERLGFRVGARNRHPWGTHNRLVQFPGCFIEILSVEEPDKIVAGTDTAFSFGGFNRDFLAQVGEGLSCLVLEGHDPPAEKAALDAAGFGGFDLLQFARKGRRADGTETEVGFKIAFGRDPTSPHAAFFTCLQTNPESFWAEELQRHANGARAVAAVVLVAQNPTDHHIFLEAFSGARAPHASSLGLTVATPRGLIQVYEPRAFQDVFGLDAPQGDGLRIAALVFAVDDPAKVRALAARNGIATSEHAARLVVGPRAAHGAVLAFSR
jgi:catechol 2,3-dioxygenase-like lactoylglutathione lyase family enzyme